VEAGGLGLDALWNDDFHHALHVALTGERDGYYEDFEGTPESWPTCWSTGTGTTAGAHRSAPRSTGGPGPRAGTGLDRLVGYAQNHDQIGNRARGDRLTHVAGTEVAYAAPGAPAPFVPDAVPGRGVGGVEPLPYFTDHPDPELADAVRRAAAPSSPPSAGTPRTSPTRRTPPRELRDARQGAIEVHADDDAGWLRFRRGRIEVAVNLGAAAVEVPLPADLGPVLAASPGAITGQEDAAVLPRGGALVLEVIEAVPDRS
jgi:maltooligosyltrehalose trehalohydrolase